MYIHTEPSVSTLLRMFCCSHLYLLLILLPLLLQYINELSPNFISSQFLFLSKITTGVYYFSVVGGIFFFILFRNLIRLGFDMVCRVYLLFRVQSKIL